MSEKEILLSNLEKIHTTLLGEERIKRNLLLDVEDVVKWCKEEIQKSSFVYKKGKNYYVEVDCCKICINSYSYTIITAHTMK